MVSWDTRRLSSSGYWVFSHPEICLGDQSRISLLATMFRNFRWMERRQRLGRKADCQASPSAGLARYAGRPPCRATSRLTVDTARCKHLAISRIDEPEASPRGAHASVLPEQSHRDATPDNEWRNVLCQRRDRSDAASGPPSNDATHRSSAPRKGNTHCVEALLNGGANASLTDKVLSTLGTRTLEIAKLTAPTFHAEFENYAEGSMPR